MTRTLFGLALLLVSMPAFAQSDDRDAVPLARGNDGMLDRALRDVVEHLIAGDAPGPGDADDLVERGRALAELGGLLVGELRELGLELAVDPARAVLDREERLRGQRIELRRELAGPHGEGAARIVESVLWDEVDISLGLVERWAFSEDTDRINKFFGGIQRLAPGARQPERLHVPAQEVRQGAERAQHGQHPQGAGQRHRCRVR